MKHILLLIILIVGVMMGCKKEQPEPENYTIKIETSLSQKYSLKMNSTTGIETIYLDQKALSGLKTFTITPKNNEIIALSYNAIGLLGLVIHVNDKKVIGQIQPGGQGVIYIKSTGIHNLY